MIHETAGIHLRAQVDRETVHIGANTRVWQFASVIRGARLGSDCNVASGACIDGSRVGNGTKIAHNVAMGPGFWIGDGCFIGPNVVFCNDAWPRAHMDGFDPSRFNEYTHAVVMDDGASIGAGSVILPGVHIGKGAMIAAGSVVTRDVPPGWLWKGGEAVAPIAEERARMRFVPWTERT